MSRLVRVFGGAFVILVLGLFLKSHQASAASVQINGITVSPAVVNVNLKTKQASYPLVFKVTNSRPVTQSLKLSTADFNTLEDTGGLLFVGSNPTDLQQRYGLAEWLELAQKNLKLAPGQTATVRAQIINRTDMAGGGHYGAIMFALNKSGTTSGDNTIGLNSIASALLFVNKIGGDTHSLNLVKVDSGGSLFNLPSNVTLHFLNTGNTHLIPRGTVDIVGPAGWSIGHGVINQDSNIVLPGMTRDFKVQLSQLRMPLLPGKYHLKVNYRFDGYPNFQTYQKGLFLALPEGLILSLAVIGGLFYLVRKTNSRS